MKIYIITIIFLFTCFACKKASFEVDHPEQYTNLYMPQATDLPNIRTLFIRDTAQTIFFNAFYGGTLNPATDIKVNFEVAPELIDSFNRANETNYPVLPAGSYTIETEGYITPSSKSTGSLQLKILTKGYIDVFKPYLLPVRIKGNDGDIPVKDDLRTAFFLITASYAPGQVPRDHMVKIENGDLSIFQWGAGSTAALIVRRPDNNMWRYPYNGNGTFAAPVQIGSGWGDVDIFFPFINPPNNDRWITRRKDGAIVHHLWTPTGGYISSAQTGAGWNNNDLIIGHRGNVYNRNITTGVLTRWTYITGFTGGPYSVPGTWASFTQIVPYKNTLLGVEPNGDLIEHQMGADGALGAVRKVGSGWDMYKKIFQFENDLFAVDNNGDVWRYQFNPIGFWALK
jgi:hypothetical protein